MPQHNIALRQIQNTISLQLVKLINILPQQNQ